MSSLNNLDLLEDIRLSIKRILLYSKGMEYQEFCSNYQAQDTIIRNFEIIGEAAKKLTSEFKFKFSSIDWKKLAGMRDKLIHDYSSINYDVVWETIENDIPKLDVYLENILKARIIILNNLLDNHLLRLLII